MFSFNWSHHGNFKRKTLPSTSVRTTPTTTMVQETLHILKEFKDGSPRVHLFISIPVTTSYILLGQHLIFLSLVWCMIFPRMSFIPPTINQCNNLDINSKNWKVMIFSEILFCVILKQWYFQKKLFRFLQEQLQIEFTTAIPQNGLNFSRGFVSTLVISILTDLIPVFKIHLILRALVVYMKREHSHFLLHFPSFAAEGCFPTQKLHKLKVIVELYQHTGSIWNSWFYFIYENVQRTISLKYIFHGNICWTPIFSFNIFCFT